MSNQRTAKPLNTWNRLREGNERLANPGGSPRQAHSTGHPIAAVFRCADAAQTSEVIFDQSLGSVLNVSTLGHVIDAGVLATMEYAVGTLEVPLIVVLGHQGCSAMQIALQAWNEAIMPEGALRAVAEQTMSSIVRRGCTAESVDSVTVAHIVDTGLALLEHSPVISRRVDAGSCGIVCVTMDLDGRLRTHATIGALGQSHEALLECV
ncbi:MAG: carbonic anhydrase [Mycobacterium sp.]|nr:carbonic anhydrase [Mycobacterium sp.]